MTNRQIDTADGLPISRREFSRCMFAAGAMTFFGRSSSGADERSTAETIERYVDVHTHLTLPWSNRAALDRDAMLEWMHQRHVSQAVILPLVSPEGWFYAISNDWVLDQTKNHRDRLLPFCDIDPRTVNLGGFSGILDQLKRYVDAGAIGLGEHKCGVAIDDPRNLDVFHAASQLRLPIMLHIDTVRNVDRPGLPGLEKAIQVAPDATFIGHAQGWWASISGDVQANQMSSYPKTPVVEGGAIDRLMDKYPNLYGDLSAGSGANAIRRDPKFGREFLIRRADRLLFGTDYLMPGQKLPQFDLLNELDLPSEVKEKICYKNACRILGISESS